jgi:ATP:corrinoid adenosyltransferase
MSDTTHHARMERLKLPWSEGLRRLRKKSLLMLYAGAGKDKTIAAQGMAIRYLRHG